MAGEHAITLTIVFLIGCLTVCPLLLAWLARRDDAIVNRFVANCGAASLLGRSGPKRMERRGTGPWERS
jgi:hypothetical protein